MHNALEALAVPYPITVTLDRVPEGDEIVGPVDLFLAHSPEWPESEGHGGDPGEAILRLFQNISNLQATSPEFNAALERAGYGLPVQQAWSHSIANWRFPELRHDARGAICWLDAYAAEGVRGTLACQYLEMGLSPEAAGVVQRGGKSPAECRIFVDALGTFVYEHHGDIRTSAFALEEDAIVAWILSEFDVEEAKGYSGALLDVVDAREWREATTQFQLTFDDLRDLRRAGMTPSQVRESSASYEAAGMSVADAARTLLALARPSTALEYPPF